MDLSSIRKGKVIKPPRVLLYGVEGVGKSTFAASAPSPIFVATEDGQDQIDCDKFPLCGSWDAAIGCLHTLATAEHEYKTVVVDSVDWLERLIWDRVCNDHGVNSIDKAAGGYGKGYTAAMNYWKQFIGSLDYLREERGMIVVLIAHSAIENFNDPEGIAYDRYTPRLHKIPNDYLREWVDATLFACRVVRVQKEESGFNKTRGIATAIGKAGGDRVLRTVGGPACVAKNRYSISDDLPLSWAAFEAAVSAGVA